MEIFIVWLVFVTLGIFFALYKKSNNITNNIAKICMWIASIPIFILNIILQCIGFIFITIASIFKLFLILIGKDKE
ncbi:hypothetical protein [Campylobacter sp. 1569]|uniref:hypothetical protein n=1 Tax=Campylobacter sp. 1569 TaxID=2735746 RepID=UPI00301E43E3|nr:hypothetical protein [Campylobacter sp. 1569]